MGAVLCRPHDHRRSHESQPSNVTQSRSRSIEGATRRQDEPHLQDGGRIRVIAASAEKGKPKVATGDGRSPFAR